MRKLKIAQLSTPFISIPPHNYGGIELVVDLLTNELVKRGHGVTLLAPGDSKTSASLLSYFDKALSQEDMAELFSPLAYKLSWMHSLPALLHIEKLIREANNFDVIHNHFHYLPLFFSNQTKTPMINTYHGDFLSVSKSSVELMMLERYKDLPWIAISEAQKRNCPVNLNFEAVIYHGIEIEKYPFNPESEDYLVWLGRITAKKGILEAIHVAKTLGEKLVIMGVVKPRDEEFYKAEVEPEFSDLVYNLGPVGIKQKSEVLGKAKALLYPITWEEPFGLVMIEAMGTGTPVIAFDNGSVSEIVKDGEVGFVVKTAEEMIEAVGKIDQIDRNIVRKHVEENFTVEKMVDKYEEVYNKISQAS